jgi:hypothetical protein
MGRFIMANKKTRKVKKKAPVREDAVMTGEMLEEILEHLKSDIALVKLEVRGLRFAMDSKFAQLNAVLRAGFEVADGRNFDERLKIHLNDLDADLDKLTTLFEEQKAWEEPILKRIRDYVAKRDSDA